PASSPNAAGRLLYAAISFPHQPRERQSPCQRPQVKLGDSPMTNDEISILDGSTFLVSRANGDIDARPDQPHGLFFGDTRHLSKWNLTVQGESLEVLSTDTLEYYLAQHFCTIRTGTIYKDHTVSVIRRRFIGDGLVENLALYNHGSD